MTDFTYALSKVDGIEVFVRKWSTGEVVSLTKNRIFPHENFTEPAWSPSGNYIVFSAIDPGNEGYAYEIFAIDVQTGEIMQLTDNNRNDDNPYWRPCHHKQVG